MGEWRTAVPDEYKDQVEELYQKQKREAEAETYEALKQDMLDHQRSISKHTVEEHLQSVIKTICTTDLRSLLKRMPQFEKLLRKIARLEVLGDHLFQKQSKGWLEHSLKELENQVEAKNPPRANGYDYSHRPAMPEALTFSAPAIGAPSRGSRGKEMVQQAMKPNPSTVPKKTARMNGNQAAAKNRSAARDIPVNKRVNESNFYPDDYGNMGLNASGKKTAPKPKSKSGQVPPLPNLHPVNGGAQVLAPVPQQTRRSARAHQQSHQNNPIYDGKGTEANPITLSDTDDEDGARPTAGLVRHNTRLATGSIQPSLIQGLQGLRCVVPPGGGEGAVEFTASDYARLGPEEFLNDTAIDYYIRWLRMDLEQRDPEAAKRCYFFNSFFYKKLTEKEGGKLPNDVQKWVEAKGIKGEELRHLRNYYKVRKWTRDVDLFEKDYIFVPIHDHLHWSIVILCHPSADLALGGGGSQTRKKGGNGRKRTVVVDDSDSERESSQDPRIAPRKQCFLLHLDSLNGGHTTKPITNILSAYLTNEWRATVDDPEAPLDCIPKIYKQQHPDDPYRSFAEMKQSKPTKIPRQDNHCDCGLFVCTFVEYFLYSLPPALNVQAVQQVQRDRANDFVDLWEGSEHCYPGFLTKGWFPQNNAGKLRWEMSLQVLRDLGRTNGLCTVMEVEDGSGAGNVASKQYDVVWTKVDTLESEEQKRQFNALFNAYDEARENKEKEKGSYFRPARQLKIAKEKKRRDAQKRQQEIIEAEARRKGNQKIVAYDDTSDDDFLKGVVRNKRRRSPVGPDREKTAAAAEARRSGRTINNTAPANDGITTDQWQRMQNGGMPASPEEEGGEGLVHDGDDEEDDKVGPVKEDALNMDMFAITRGLPLSEQDGKEKASPSAGILFVGMKEPPAPERTYSRKDRAKYGAVVAGKEHKKEEENDDDEVFLDALDEQPNSTTLDENFSLPSDSEEKQLPGAGSAVDRQQPTDGWVDPGTKIGNRRLLGNKAKDTEVLQSTEVQNGGATADEQSDGATHDEMKDDVEKMCMDGGDDEEDSEDEEQQPRDKRRNKRRKQKLQANRNGGPSPPKLMSRRGAQTEHGKRVNHIYAAMMEGQSENNKRRRGGKQHTIDMTKDDIGDRSW